MHSPSCSNCKIFSPKKERVTKFRNLATRGISIRFCAKGSEQFSDRRQFSDQRKGILDIRIKLVIDDGTGTVNGIIGRETTEKLLGKTLDEWKKIAEKSKDENIVIQEINNMLFSHRVNLQGNALGDQYGTTVIVKNVRLADINITKESEKLARELEELQ